MFILNLTKTEAQHLIIVLNDLVSSGCSCATCQIRNGITAKLSLSLANPDPVKQETSLHNPAANPTGLAK